MVGWSSATRTCRGIFGIYGAYMVLTPKSQDGKKPPNHASRYKRDSLIFIHFPKINWFSHSKPALIPRVPTWIEGQLPSIWEWDCYHSTSRPLYGLPVVVSWKLWNDDMMDKSNVLNHVYRWIQRLQWLQQSINPAVLSPMFDREPLVWMGGFLFQEKP